MKPSVKMIKGTHLTAADKRNILGCIEFLRTEDNHSIWMGRKGSKKRYSLAPDPEIPNRYSVLIKENYTSDFGQKRENTTTYIIETRGVDPLPSADCSIAQGELFGEGAA